LIQKQKKLRLSPPSEKYDYLLSLSIDGGGLSPFNQSWRAAAGAALLANNNYLNQQCMHFLIILRKEYSLSFVQIFKGTDA